VILRGPRGGKLDSRGQVLTRMRFELMLAVPIRWADPRTWPWVVWAWVAFLLAGWAVARCRAWGDRQKTTALIVTQRVCADTRQACQLPGIHSPG